jgi:hypothetical protein
MRNDFSSKGSLKLRYKTTLKTLPSANTLAYFASFKVGKKERIQLTSNIDSALRLSRKPILKIVKLVKSKIKLAIKDLLSDI